MTVVSKQTQQILSQRRPHPKAYSTNFDLDAAHGPTILVRCAFHYISSRLDSIHTHNCGCQPHGKEGQAIWEAERYMGRDNTNEAYLWTSFWANCMDRMHFSHSTL